MRNGPPIGATLVLLLSLVVTARPAAAGSPSAADGYGAAYAGQSAFTAAPAGATARLTAIYANIGSRPWLPGSIGLLVCAEDQVTCGVPSPNAAYASGWYSTAVYATVGSLIAPGQNAFFSYDIAVPLGTDADVTTVFYGAVGLIEAGTAFQLDGYHQSNTTPGPTARRLRATFLLDPIPADGQASSTLQVDVLGQSGELDTTDDQTVVAIAAADASPIVCRIQVRHSTAQHGRALFDIVSTEDPGSCDLEVSDDRGASTVATLTTKLAGSPVRLTVSGNDSPRVVGGGAPVIVAVDIDDVNVVLVGDDSTTVVRLALDPSSCTGAPGGDVYATSGGAAAAVNGRAWFTLRSNGAYTDCQATVTAPGLRPNVTTVSFLAGPPDHVTCAFSPAVIDADGTSTASVEMRDVFGNSVPSIDPYAVTFTRISGDATTLLGETAAQPLVRGAAFFTVRAGLVQGTDVYAAILRETAGSPCAVTVRSPAP